LKSETSFCRFQFVGRKGSSSRKKYLFICGNILWIVLSEQPLDVFSITIAFGALDRL